MAMFLNFSTCLIILTKRRFSSFNSLIASKEIIMHVIVLVIVTK